MRVLRRRDQHRIDLFERQQLFQMLKRAGRMAVVPLAVGDRPVAIAGPEVAHGHCLHVVLVLQAGGHHVQPAATVADADVAQPDPIVGTEDAAVRQGARGDRGAGDHAGGEKCSAVELRVVV